MTESRWKSLAGRLLRQLVAGAAGISLLAAHTTPASAQGVGFIRDAEIESLLADYARPILGAAGFGTSSVRIHLVGSQAFNAFVADGRRIFVNAGVIMEAETPGEVIGVLAHETGHIAGGHLARLRLELDNASALATIATLLGAGAMAAGAAAGSGGAGRAGQAVAIGGSQIAQRVLLKYQRGEEAAADQAAVKYLAATGQSARGMLKTFQRMADQSIVSSRHANPYTRSHPMPRDRIAALENLARKSPHFEATEPPALAARHDLARAKLYGYMAHPSSVERRYPPGDNSAAAYYARAIAAMRSGRFQEGLAGLDALTRTSPSYPYFWEAKGEMLIRAGRPRDAVEPLRRALSLAPQAALTKVTLAQALLAFDQPSQTGEAVQLLTSALQAEPEFGAGYRQLAMAYGRQGDIPRAELATAEGHLADGNVELAKRFAQRARQGLKTGSPAWLKADDILSLPPS